MHTDEIIHHQRQEIEYMREQLHVQVRTALWCGASQLFEAPGPNQIVCHIRVSACRRC